MTWRNRGSSLARPAALAALAALGLATVLAGLAPFGWLFELFSHFRVQYAVVAALLVLLLAWQRRPALTGVALVLTLWHVMPGVQRAMAEAPGAACEAPPFTVATANLLYTNPRREPFLDWLERYSPDLIVVQEVTPDWVPALRGLGAYPHQYVLPRTDPYGIGILSRWPLESVTQVDLAEDGIPALVGIAEIHGKRIRVLGMHTRWPVLPHLARSRDTALQHAAELVRGEDLPVVTLGDLNLTPDAPAFERLLATSGLRDAVDGRHWRPTWQAGFWPLALRIDHVLVSRKLCVDHAEVGESIGSDHRPVLARLRVQAPPAAKLTAVAAAAD
jgi:endonuclease/exonuclease/phosphatase (EEP) superfamily protein YafD